MFSLFSVFVMLMIQVWQCGGSVEVLPCARIAHIERAHKPYTEDLTSHVRRNALRVAEVWMDEFKSHVYMAWNIPMEVSDHGNSDVSLIVFYLQCRLGITIWAIICLVINYFNIFCL